MEVRFGLVTINPFPIGNVSTVRYSSYCKALAKRGVYSKVYVMAPSKTAAPNRSVCGVEDGVLYEYVCRKITWERAPSLAEKVFYYLVGLIRTALLLRRDKVNCVVLYSSDFASCIFFWLYTFIYPFCLLTDKSEYPYGYASMGQLAKYFQRLKLRVFDGFIVMTNELVDFYRRVQAKKSDVFYLPMTVDAKKFEGLKKAVDSESYIAAVFGVHNRDGLLDSVKAYRLYREDLGLDANRLWLIGDFKNLINRELVANYIAEHGLHDCVVFKGLVPYKDMPQILVNAECLITTAREYTSGGFPTKLGEYLLSGAPVVATSAGEISLYLKDCENAFLAEPGDFQGVANKLVFVHRNRDRARVVAERGRVLAGIAFNADSYTKDLVDFMRNRCLKRQLGSS